MFQTKVCEIQEHGSSLLNTPLLNKGTGFPYSERERMGLRGLVPPTYLPLHLQEQRVLNSLEECKDDIEKYINLTNLMDRNETLYYRVLCNNLKKLAPIIYTPTVGIACQKFSAIYRRSRGMYFTPDDKGEMNSMIYNWPSKEVDVIVVTDGSRVLGLGDLGCHGMAIPIGKLALYVAVGGVHPSKVLPIQLDFGTNNQKLLSDPLYIGRKTKRVSDSLFVELMDEFITAVTSRWPNVLIQFEDFSSPNAYNLLHRYKHNYLIFNDDIQGTGAVVLAGILGYMKVLNIPFSDITKQRIVCLGGGSAGIGVLDAIRIGMEQEGSCPTQTLKNFYVVDKDGLIGKNRAFGNQLLYAKENDLDGLSLLETIKKVKPTILLGLSGAGGTFTQEIIEEMLQHCERPLICPLSNPTAQAECTAEEAFKWSKGKALVSTGSPFDPVQFQGKTLYASQGNNMYVFPGLGLMSIITRLKFLPDSLLYVAATALADSLTNQNIKDGKIFPDIEKISDVSKKITLHTAQHAWDIGIAKNPRPESIENMIELEYYSPLYQPLVRSN